MSSPATYWIDPEAGASVTTRHLLTHTAGWVGDIFLDIDVVLQEGKLFAILHEQEILAVETKTPPLPPQPLGVCAEDQLMFLAGRYKNRTLDYIPGEGAGFKWLRLSQRIHKKAIN